MKTVLIFPLAFTLALCYRQFTTTPRPEIYRRQFNEALEAILGVTVRLQVLLENHTSAESNFIVSPPSIAVVLGELMLGAKGRFVDELYDLLALPKAARHNSYIFHHNSRRNFSYMLPHSLLHLQLGNLIKALRKSDGTDSFTLHMTNALFYNSELKLEEEFLNNLKIYATQLNPLNFREDPIGSQRYINDWCFNNTKGLIDVLLPTPLPPTASAIFADAVYFSADWETPFSKDLNSKDVFLNSKETSTNVTFMTGLLENIPYADSKELQCRLVGLPYKNRELIMYIIMPYEEHALKFNIREFATSLKPKLVLSFIESAQNQTVAIQLPKLEVSSTFSILEPLRKYAMYKSNASTSNDRNTTKDSLDMIKEKIDDYIGFNADHMPEIVLEGAAQNRSLRISNLLQQVTLLVNEKGTEAAAVTSSIIDYMGGSKSFRVNRPFVFFIRHEATLATLFWGTIVRP